jgi:Secretion system C-terminal sorting domain
MKASLTTAFLLVCSALCLKAQLSPNWVKMASPKKTAESIYRPCDLPTFFLDGQAWQSPDLGQTWQTADSVSLASQPYWTTTETIYETNNGSCQTSSKLIKFYDCQSPDTPYFQYTSSGESCWHSGGYSYDMTVLSGDVFVLGTSTWQYMGTGSYCAQTASLDFGRTWFNVSCDFANTYHPDSSAWVTQIGNDFALFLRPSGYAQQYDTLPLPANLTGYPWVNYLNGNIFLFSLSDSVGIKLYISNDYGQQWKVDTLPKFTLLKNPSYAVGYFFLETDIGLYYKSTLLEDDFTALYQAGAEYSTHIASSYADGELAIVSTHDGKIQISQDLGQTWALADVPIYDLYLNWLHHNGASLMAQTSHSRIYRWNNDSSYYRVDYPWDSEYPKAVFKAGNICYRVYENSSLLRSFDQGQIWDTISLANHFGNDNPSLIKHDGDTICLSTGNWRIIFSADSAHTWQTIDLPINFGLANFEVAANNWIGLTWANRLFLRDFGSGTWSDITPNDFNPTKLGKTGNRIYALGTTDSVNWNVRFWDPANHSWTLVGDVLTASSDVQFSHNGFFLVQTQGSVYVRSAESPWTQMEIPSSSPISWAMNNDTLFVATESQGIWKAAIIIDNCQRFSNTNFHLCQGDSILYHGQYLSQPYLLAQHFPSVDGTPCDSTAILHVTVSDSLHVQHISICEGDSVQFGSEWLGTAGSYSAHYTSLQGCDSIAQLNLTVFPTNVFETILTCFGYQHYSSYTWQWYSTPGQYEELFYDANGCLSTYHLDLSFLPEPEIVEMDTFVTFPFTIDWATYYFEDTHYHHFQDSNGCYNTLVLHIYEDELNNTKLKPSNAGIAIFPNPASTSVTLQFDTPPLVGCAVHFINQLGQKLLAKQLNGSSKTHSIDISDLTTGLYFVEISGPNQRTFTTKLHIVR